MKTCNRCGALAPMSQYYKNKKSADGHLGICKSCVRDTRRVYVAKNRDTIAERMRVYRRDNKDAVRAVHMAYVAAHRDRLKSLKREKATGFSNQLFQRTLESQNFCCAICGVDLNTLPSQQRHADHCHQTGAPRGVLCQTCNTGMGKFKDDPQLLRKAVAYLENPPAFEIERASK